MTGAHMGKFISTVLSLILVSTLDVHSNEGDSESAEQLVVQLGAETFAERQEAATKLLAMGHNARPAVKAALESEDLEVRIRAEKIWNRIRWAFYPGKLDETTIAEMNALAESMEETQGRQSVNVTTTWKSLFSRNGNRTLGLLIAIHDAYPKNISVVNVGMKVLTDGLEIEEFSKAIDELPGGVSAESLRNTIARAVSGSMSHEQHGKLMRIGLKIEDFPLALSCGSSAWVGRRDVKLAEEIADAARDGKQDALWDSAMSLFEDGVGDQLAKVSFCITLAALLENKETARTLVEKLEVPDGKDDALVFLHEQLGSLEMAHLLTPSMTKSNDPQVLYLAHLTLRDQGLEAESEATWEKVFVHLKKESQCYQLGEKMGKMGDDRRERVWKKILEMDPVNSVYDANARFRLAPILEKRGEFAESADMLEAAMKNMKGALLMTKSDGTTISGEEAKKVVFANIATLREKARKVAEEESKEGE